MNWYWVFVKYHQGVDTAQHRFQAENDNDALQKAKEWCRGIIGFYNYLAVAKEISIFRN